MSAISVQAATPSPGQVLKLQLVATISQTLNPACRSSKQLSKVIGVGNIVVVITEDEHH